MIIRINSQDLSIHVKPGFRGEIVEIDNKNKALNIINTVSRRVEPYHEKIKKRSFLSKINLKNCIKKKMFFNIYDILGFKNKNLAKVLAYDNAQKTAFIDYFIFGKYSIKEMIHSIRKNLYEISSNAYEIERMDKDSQKFIYMHKTEDMRQKDISFDIKKKIGLNHPNTIEVSYELKNISVRRVRGVFATEVNLSMYNENLCCVKQLKNVSNLFLNDQWTSSQMKIMISEPLDVRIIPVYTVNESEEGIDETYQYIRMLFMKKICLEKDEKLNLKFEIKVT
jgi:hypothetical protein